MPNKFFLEDIVRDKNSNEPAVVLRCWTDHDEAPHDEEIKDPLMRPLLKGQIGVADILTGKRQIVSDEDYVLVDRTFHLGDICKRSLDDVMSGVVTSCTAEINLEHAISNLPTRDQWIAQDLIKTATPVMPGDFAVYGDWVGQVEEIFEETIGELAQGNQLFRFAELGTRHRVGDRSLDIHLAVAYTPSNPPEVIIQVNPIVLCIAWLGINQTLPPHEAEDITRPPRFFWGAEASHLTIIRPHTEHLSRIGDRVKFRDPAVAAAQGVQFTRHGINVVANSIQVDTLVVRGTRMTVTVLWQDGTVENLSSTSLIPHLNIDELDCWPGDFVLWKEEAEERVAVVQSLNAQERTAEVLWYPPPSEKALVSVLELDPHGSTAPFDPEGFGVRRGDFVFIHPEGHTNGSLLPRVPKIGEVESWVRDNDPHGWRQDMVHTGMNALQQNVSGGGERIVLTPADPNVRWFGEVVNLRLSGEIEVALPSGDVVVVTVDRLSVLHEGLIDEISDYPWGDEDSDEDMDGGSEYDAPYTIPGQASVPAFVPQDHDSWSRGSWETINEPEHNDWAHLDAEVPSATVQIPPKPLTPAPTPADQISKSSSPEPPPSTSDTSSVASGSATPLVVPPLETTTSAVIPLADIDPADTPWQCFDIQPTPPLDHAFLSKPSQGQPSRAYHVRLAKEYRVLSTSLPDNILVRAYEDRTDLLRSLIIGPENTPYEDAPFVIDWFLPPEFPQTPPVAHFHSWTNGNGRVNPNLYEEGKVCLSILGTWAGDKSESWSPSRSSLLQAFVSIQGLVLVKEPWYCEPAFEKLRGTDEGAVNSRLYNEKAYVLARGFVRRALETPVGGLADPIHWLYITRGKLSKVIQQAEALIDASANGGELAAEKDGRAVSRLTAGGILPLRRTLVKLKGLLPPTPSEPTS